MKTRLAAVFLTFAISAPAYATSIQCDTGYSGYTRTVTMTYTGSGIVDCGPSGVTAGGTPEGTYFSLNGYNFLEKDQDPDGDNNGGLLNVSGVGVFGGEFSIASTVTDAVLVFKFGAGQYVPDWISFVMNGITAGSWVVAPTNGSLSHATLYGQNDTTVPTPATLALLGLGALGLGFSRRRKQA